MNKQVSHIGIAALVLLAALIVANHVLADVGERGACEPAGQRDPARRAVHDQARQDLRVRRPHAPRDERDQEGRRPDPVLPPLPDGAALLRRRRLLDAVAEPNGPRAVVQRLSHRLECQPRHGLSFRARQAERHDGHRERPRVDDPARSAGTCIATSARQVRSRCRAGSDDGPRARDGNEPDLQPEPGREALRPRDADEPSLWRSASEPCDRR